MQTEIQQSFDELCAAARTIVGLRAEIEAVKRQHRAGEISNDEALHILTTIIFAIEVTGKHTKH
jgi:hypothetical protein